MTKHQRELIDLQEKLKWGLRPCIVYDSRASHVALFHRWVDESRLNSTRIINHDGRIDDHLKTYALVEICETGAVRYCKPQDMVFISEEFFVKCYNDEIKRTIEFMKEIRGKK